MISAVIKTQLESQNCRFRSSTFHMLTVVLGDDVSDKIMHLVSNYFEQYT